MHNGSNTSSSSARKNAQQTLQKMSKDYLAVTDEYGRESADAVMARLKKNRDALASRETD